MIESFNLNDLFYLSSMISEQYFGKPLLEVTSRDFLNNPNPQTVGAVLPVQYLDIANFLKGPGTSGDTTVGETEHTACFLEFVHQIRMGIGVDVLYQDSDVIIFRSDKPRYLDAEFLRGFAAPISVPLTKSAIKDKMYIYVLALYQNPEEESEKSHRRCGPDGVYLRTRALLDFDPDWNEDTSQYVDTSLVMAKEVLNVTGDSILKLTFTYMDQWSRLIYIEDKLDENDIPHVNIEFSGGLGLNSLWEMPVGEITSIPIECKIARDFNLSLIFDVEDFVREHNPGGMLIKKIWEGWHYCILQCDRFRKVKIYDEEDEVDLVESAYYLIDFSYQGEPFKWVIKEDSDDK